MAMKISKMSEAFKTEVDKADSPEVFDALQRLAFSISSELKETFGDRFDRRKFLKDCRVDPAFRPAAKTGLVRQVAAPADAFPRPSGVQNPPTTTRAANVATINGSEFTFNVNLPWAANYANALCFQHRDYKFTYEKGRKYDKVWVAPRTNLQGRSIHCFIEKDHAQRWVLKPGSISGPQRDPETGEPARRYSMSTYAEFFSVVRRSDPHGSYLYKMTRSGARRKPSIRRRRIQ